MTRPTLSQRLKARAAARRYLATMDRLTPGERTQAFHALAAAEIWGMQHTPPRPQWHDQDEQYDHDNQTDRQP